MLPFTVALKVPTLFQEVMQDYRDEVKDFFTVDKQLASELEYDMKKYNEQLAQEELQRQVAEAEGTMPIQVPQPSGVPACPEVLSLDTGMRHGLQQAFLACDTQLFSQVARPLGPFSEGKSS